MATNNRFLKSVILLVVMIVMASSRDFGQTKTFNVEYETVQGNNLAWDRYPIEGFAWPSSVAPGDTVRFYVSVENIAPSDSSYVIDIFRLPDQTNSLWTSSTLKGHFYPLRDSTGYLIYPGDTQHKPVDYKLGCKDFWAPTAIAKKIESNWKSGLYYARFNHLSLSENDANKYFYAPFVVRSTHPGNSTKILFKFDFNTFMAYTYWGGGSLYSCAHDPQSLAITDTIATDRPIVFWSGARVTWRDQKDNYVSLFTTLDSLGYQMDYCNNIDIDAGGTDFLSHYNMLVLFWHDEYWSPDERTNIENFKGDRQSGLHGNIARFAPNTCFWRIHWPNRNTGDYRKLQCHKGDCTDSHQTDLWRNTQYGPGLPEAKLLDEQWERTWTIQDHQPPDTVYKHTHWIFNGTSLQKGSAFGYGFVENGIHRVGLVFGELDNTISGKADFPLDTLAQSWVDVSADSNPALKQTTYYEDTTTNARVFADGSSGWGMALDSRADHADDLTKMKIITDNIFSHFSGKKYLGKVYTDSLHVLTWDQNTELDDDVNIPSGKYLKIINPAVVTIDNDVQLFVNGTLEINGNVTITGAGSLNINPGGVLKIKANSTLTCSFFILESGGQIVYESGAKLVLDQSVIENGATLTAGSGGTLEIASGGTMSFGTGSTLNIQGEDTIGSRVTPNKMIVVK